MQQPNQQLCNKRPEVKSDDYACYCVTTLPHLHCFNFPIDSGMLDAVVLVQDLPGLLCQHNAHLGRQEVNRNQPVLHVWSLLSDPLRRPDVSFADLGHAPAWAQASQRRSHHPRRRQGVECKAVRTCREGKLL